MLVTMKEVLRIAADRKIAVGGFNCATLESARAAIGAAEELGLPFILQHAQVHDVYMPLRLAAPIMLALAKDATVPVCVHLDHGTDPDYVKKAIELGFTSIMYDASAKPYDVNLRETAEMASFAHAAGVSVEAELGRMPGGDEAVTPENCYTDPGEAAIFAAETGVDALAISFGTAHGVYKTTPKLSIDVVRRVAEATGGLPLVMHGGSGVSHADYHAAIEAGIRKINYYTYEALAGGKGTYAAVKKQPDGLQFHDVAMTATAYMKEDVATAMRVFTGMDA